MPSARVLNPSMVRFLYRLRRCSSTCSRLPSRFKKCGYCRLKVSSRLVSSKPFAGRTSSLERRVRLLDCILTAMEMDVRSLPSGRKTTSLDNVSEHNLNKELWAWGCELWFVGTWVCNWKASCRLPKSRRASSGRACRGPRPPPRTSLCSACQSYLQHRTCTDSSGELIAVTLGLAFRFTS